MRFNGCWKVTRTCHIQSSYVRVYTDSQYSRNMLLKPIPKGKHFYLVESILGLGNRIRSEFDIVVTLHWIPSHIEHTIGGWRPIFGNRRADKLAEQARNSSRREHSERQVAKRRERTIGLVARFFRVMETTSKQFQTLELRCLL